MTREEHDYEVSLYQLGYVARMMQYLDERAIEDRGQIQIGEHNAARDLLDGEVRLWDIPPAMLPHLRGLLGCAGLTLLERPGKVVRT
jgi:hypothetical protein